MFEERHQRYQTADRTPRTCTDDRQQQPRPSSTSITGKLSKYDAITTVHRADTEQTTLSRVVTDVIVERQDIWYIKPTVFAFHRRLRTGSLNNRLGASDGTTSVPMNRFDVTHAE